MTPVGLMEDFDTDSLSSGKKVRFNSNDEIFVIPNKWDRLSRKTGSGKEKLAKDSCSTSKPKVLDAERRGKSKQRSKKVKKNTKGTHTKTSITRTFGSPSSQVLQLESSVLSTEISKTRWESSKAPDHEKKSKKTEAPEIKLKLSHRNNRELSQDDIVLPRINYNSDLRKTIEHAVVRNRPSCEPGLSRLHEQSRETLGFSSLRTRLHSDSNSSTNSSILEDEDNVTYQEECVLVLPERETKFSELSRNVDSWSPFSNGQSTENRTSRRHKMPATLVIPNSILY